MRGGSPDQNLILLDHIDVYNPTHFGGVFSTFNTDAVENVELLKGGFPAKYGGRLSSVLNVHNIDGNRKRHEGIARLSLISSSATIQGPWALKNRKGAYMLSFRRTYLDVIKKMLDIEMPDYYFYDTHARVTWDIDDKDKLAISTFMGKDNLDMEAGSDMNMHIDWGNKTVSTEWVHIFNPQLFSKFILAGSHFSSLLKVSFEDDYEMERSNDVYDVTTKGLLSYEPNDKHLFDFGFEAKYNNIGFLMSLSEDIDPNSLPDIDVSSLINAFYFQDSWEAGPLWTIQEGLRITHCHTVGKYLDGEPSVNYYRFSPRFSIRRRLTRLSNIYFSYGRYYQYLSTLSYGISSPLDLWFPIDESIEPGKSDHFILGYKAQISDQYVIEVEAYRKNYENLIEYSLETDYEWDNDTGRLEDACNVGEGYSYGLDILLRTDWRGLEGFIGYNFGLTKRKTEDTNINPDTREEEPYYPRYDRTHQVNIMETYNLSKSLNKKILGAYLKLSLTYSYGTGQPYYEPELLYLDEENVEILPSYNDAIRLPNYSKLDLGLRLEWKIKRFNVESYFQVINVLNSTNVSSRNYSYSMDDDGNIFFESDDFEMFPRIPFFGVNIKW